MGSGDKLRAAHRHVQRTVRVPMRADLVDQLDQLEEAAKREAVVDARENRAPVAVKIAEQIREVEQEIHDSAEVFTFRAIGKRAYAAVLAENPPTAAQKADAERDSQRAMYNPDTFPPALLAASCVVPDDLTPEDWAGIWDEWSEGQTAPLYGAALAVNMGSADADPKSVIASEILNGSGQSSTTAGR